MDSLPKCCHDAAERYVEMGMSRGAAVAKALREHSQGHGSSNEFSFGGGASRDGK